MDVRPRSRVRNKISHWLHKAHNFVEGEGDANLRTNGEYHFLKSFLGEKARQGGDLVIFDVGANAGEYGDMAFEVLSDADAKRIKLYSFEPVAPFAGRGVLVKTAVSDTDGTVTFHKRKDYDMSSVHPQEWLDRKQGAAEKVQVPVMRLDTYIGKNHISHIDLLKIDVEGHELNVLKGCGNHLKPSFIKTIQFEYGLGAKASGVFFQTIRNLLLSKGYTVYKIFPRHLEEATPDWAESIEYANFVAI